MIFKTLLASCAALALASPASAQAVALKAAELGLSYAIYDIDDLPETASEAVVAGVVDFGLTDRVGVQLGGQFIRLDYEDDFGDFSSDFNSVDASAYVDVGAGAKLAAQIGRLRYDSASFDGQGFAIDEDVWRYGAALIVQAERAAFEIAAGRYEFDATDTLEGTYLGLGADYALTDQWELFGNFSLTSISDDVLDSQLDTRLVEAGARYHVGRAAFFASIGHVKGEVDDLSWVDATVYRAGVTIHLDTAGGGATRPRLFSNVDLPF